MKTDASQIIALDAIGTHDAPSLDHVHAPLSALGDLNRLRIFMLLKQGERCVCDIETGVRLSQNLVSHHLRVLREAGLISSRRDGRWVYYAINVAQLGMLRNAFSDLFDPASVGSSTAQC
jgi:ArsR family transcriptional regulator, arsenate/arsenite/antimonite-responsive transcriptional repressor